ncbi:MAG: hypothetical protein V4440_14745 [Pseudomonadota bacterium]
MDIKLAGNDELIKLSKEPDTEELCSKIGYCLSLDNMGYLTSPAVYLLQGIYQAREMLRQQIAEQPNVDAPVAWRYKSGNDNWRYVGNYPTLTKYPHTGMEPLYNKPPNVDVLVDALNEIDADLNDGNHWTIRRKIEQALATYQSKNEKE